MSPPAPPSVTPAAAPIVAPGAANARFSWLTLLVAFLLVAGSAVAKAVLTGASTPLINDTDDAMRLVNVRDLLAGQNWYDHLQHRLDTPFGAEIHWSHLIDAAIGGLILLFRPLAGGLAETLAVYVWPLLLLLALLTLLGRLAFRLGGRAAVLPALLLPAVSPALMTEFSPGRIDHDGVQILLALLMAWGAIETIERPRFALIAGLAASVSLAIGIEGLPNVVAATLAISLTWVVRPERAPALRAFGLSLALGTLGMLAIALPPSRWLQPACDEISIVYVVFAVGVGGALTLLSVLPLASRPAGLRLLLGGALGGLVAVGIALAFPLCLKGPYGALDPWLAENWLDHIAEAQPIWQSAKGFDPFTVGVAIPPLLGLLVIGIRLWRGPPAGRGQWLVLGLFLLLADAVMVWEIRGARLAGALALPAAGWLIAQARHRYLGGRKLSGGLAIVASWLGFAGLVIALLVALVTEPFQPPPDASGKAAGPGIPACLQPDAFAALAKLPPARVMTEVDLGSHVLLHTGNSVVAAPYHRAQQAILDAYHFFNGPIDQARQILAARGVTLVVICPAMPAMQGLPTAVPDSFVKLYAKQALPTWLAPIGAPDAVLKLFAVRPQ